MGALLTYAYPPSARFLLWRLEHLAGWTPDAFAAYRYFGGHFGAVLLDVLPADTLLLTVLREPVDRMLSHLRFRQRIAQELRDVPAADALRVEALRRSDWHTYLDHPSSAGEDNLLTR